MDREYILKCNFGEQYPKGKTEGGPYLRIKSFDTMASFSPVHMMRSKFLKDYTFEK